MNWPRSAGTDSPLCHDPAVGRHGVAPQRDPRPPAEPAPGRWAVALIALLVLVLGLGLWWWSERTPRDPIDAAPVSATATVLSSPGCTASGADDETVVDLGLGGTGSSTLSGCGFTPGQRIDVEYRSGEPGKVRLAGTGTAGSGGAPRWLPFLILLVGLLLLGVTATWLFFGAGRRRTVRVQQADRLSVAQLRRSLDAPDSRDGQTPLTPTVSEPHDATPPQRPEPPHHPG